MKKFYLRFEIRYNAYITDEDGDIDVDYNTIKINSDTFDTEEECIAFGNELITKNRWIEQYPGYQNLNLDRRFGRPLVAPSLKNGAQIFLSVESLDIHTLNELDEILNKFDIPKITNVIK